VRTFDRLQWPVRTLSFSHDSQYIASGSEDLMIDIADVNTSAAVHQIECRAAMNTVAWHPSRHLLAFAGDDKNKSDGRDEGSLRVFGFGG
jgi:THO complex subunit 3